MPQSSLFLDILTLALASSLFPLLVLFPLRRSHSPRRLPLLRHCSSMKPRGPAAALWPTVELRSGMANLVFPLQPMVCPAGWLLDRLTARLLGHTKIPGDRSGSSKLHTDKFRRWQASPPFDSGSHIPSTAEYSLKSGSTSSSQTRHPAANQSLHTAASTHP
jgi:hypothetical protein